MRCPAKYAPPGPGSDADAAPAYRFVETEYCVANVDTLTAALELGDACALNFANEGKPGGRYRSGGRAQEEDLCRLLPQLCASLEASGHYPIEPGTALISRNLDAVRVPGSYKLLPWEEAKQEEEEEQQQQERGARAQQRKRRKLG